VELGIARSWSATVTIPRLGYCEVISAKAGSLQRSPVNMVVILRPVLTLDLARFYPCHQACADNNESLSKSDVNTSNKLSWLLYVDQNECFCGTSRVVDHLESDKQHL
jgi:hypothetical protein